MQLSPTPAPTPDIARVQSFTVRFPDRLDTYDEPASAAGVREQVATIAAKHGVTASPLEGLFLESLPMQFQLRGTLTGASGAVDQALAAVQSIKPGETPATTKPTGPASDASSAFSLLYTEFGPSSAANAADRVAVAARQGGVELRDLEVGPAVLESFPPQGHVTGKLSGSPDAVEATLKALELLDQEL